MSQRPKSRKVMEAIASKGTKDKRKARAMRDVVEVLHAERPK